MFIVTNRNVNKNGKDLKLFGDTANENGPNELRLVAAEKKEGKWTVNILPDKITEKMKTEVNLTDAGVTYYASDYVAAVLFKKLQAEKRNLLFLSMVIIIT
ncbi:hypothetical protein [Candidatus Symbiopectobacterium sp. NZEC135]|uniref:hypothetical protein n=1 Tax=Candidatus Symbiopectobacterium sp. NZEC135 TaxID=2820471 RepID=UPI0022273BB5|nr:hypothetical protein [Candidatus Symbiopectobacterium sp. NZEC135]MCW2482506.1 hypothetical protein [Candidatus Symbiopectobacterium sp. NZEC135]